MDFLVELLGELITLPLEAAMESSRVEVWIKTMLMSVGTAFLIGVFVLLTVLVARDGVLWRTLCVAVFSIGISVFMVYRVIRGHRRGWNKE